MDINISKNIELENDKINNDKINNDKMENYKINIPDKNDIVMVKYKSSFNEGIIVDIVEPQKFCVDKIYEAFLPLKCISKDKELSIRLCKNLLNKDIFFAKITRVSTKDYNVYIDVTRLNISKPEKKIFKSEYLNQNNTIIFTESLNSGNSENYENSGNYENSENSEDKYDDKDNEEAPPLILNKYDFKNVHISYLHPAALSVNAKLVVSNFFSGTLADAHFFGAKTVEFTHYSKLALDKTNGESMNPYYIDYFINNNPKKFKNIIKNSVRSKKRNIVRNIYEDMSESSEVRKYLLSN